MPNPLSDSFVSVRHRLMEQDDPQSVRDAAILSLLFEGLLSRVEIMAMRFDDVDKEKATLRLQASDEVIELNDVTHQALLTWMAILEDQSGYLFRYIKQGSELTNSPLSPHHIYYILKKHRLSSEEKALPPRQQPPSPLAQFTTTHSLPEAGYTPANLRHLRALYQLTQADVADLLNVTQRAAQSWEVISPDRIGRREMSASVWSSLIEILYQRPLPPPLER